MGWLAGWKKRIKLTIDKDDIDDALSNFPILAYLSAASGIGDVDVSCVFDELGSDGNRKKIAVTTSNGKTQCYVEIEKWDHAIKKAWLWVKVPAVASGVDTDLYLYYDKDHIDNDTYVGDTNSTPAENVWDANFKAVYHMRDGADNEHIYDSSGNNNDGTKKAANEPIETDGQVGKAQDFDGDRIDCASTGFPDGNTARTIEFLLKINTLPTGADWDAVFYYGTMTSEDGVVIAVGDWDEAGYPHFCMSAIAAPGLYGDTELVADTVYHLVFTHDGTNQKFYLGGVLDGSTDIVTITTILDEFRIGSFGATSQYLIGIVDEVRVSSVERTTAWIKATKESLWDDLVAFGSEENVVIGPFPTHFVIR